MSRIAVQRVAYAVAALACLPVGWLVGSGQVFGLIVPGGLPPQVRGMMMLPLGLGVAAVLALLAAFVYLAWRPQWWGKLLCALPAFPWIFFSLVARTMIGILPGAARNPGVELLWMPAVCGATLLACAIVLQIANPRFSGPSADLDIRPPVA
jgi:hypothetical protein